MSSTLHENQRIEEAEWQPPGQPEQATHEPRETVKTQSQRRNRGGQPGSRLTLTNDGTGIQIGEPEPVEIAEIKSAWQPGGREKVVMGLASLAVLHRFPVYNAPSLSAIRQVIDNWTGSHPDRRNLRFVVEPHTLPDGRVIARIMRNTDRMTQVKTGAVRRGRGRPSRQSLSGAAD